MPKGPQGQKRPADVIGAAINVAKIATGEIAEHVDDNGKDKAALRITPAMAAGLTERV